MKSHVSHILSLFLITAGFALSACSVIPEAKPDPTRYYVLGAGNARTAEEAPSTKPVVGLYPLMLSDYLDAKSIVIIRGNNEVVYQEFSRWAEPLEAGITRLVRQHLTEKKVVRTLHTLPTRSTYDYDISIRVNNCEGHLDSNGAYVLFTAEYTITGTRGDTLIAQRSFEAPRAAWQSGDYADLAAKLASAIEALANDIAAHLPAQQ